VVINYYYKIKKFKMARWGLMLLLDDNISNF
jgi:hypothetical protein